LANVQEIGIRPTKRRRLALFEEFKFELDGLDDQNWTKTRPIECGGELENINAV
jgi:hypothetical protein